LTDRVPGPPRRGKRRGASIKQQHRIFADTRIGHVAKCLAILILNLQALEQAACTLSRASMCVRLGCGETTVKRALRQLRDVGWLTEETTSGGVTKRKLSLLGEGPESTGVRSGTPLGVYCGPQEGRERVAPETWPPVHDDWTGPGVDGLQGNVLRARERRADTEWYPRGVLTGTDM